MENGNGNDDKKDQSRHLKEREGAKEKKEDHLAHPKDYLSVSEEEVSDDQDDFEKQTGFNAPGGLLGNLGCGRN
ncbi:MAG: hypothetical protein LAT68_04560 [Cyclobacteriaceae bacterium]|nr:hypothetical protein [Cyclobacteriaceae bacterium]MCH8515582.1 hypothetical protein [Cyclobacteriaceae bacterium]